jgi:vesicle transport through interaction with t-SNAREs protein 1
MSSIPFERYDDEFQSLTNQIKSSLRDEDNIEFTASLLSQCDDLLKQMSVEARGVDDSNVKRDLLANVRQCKSTLSALRDEFKSKKGAHERAHLLINAGGPNGNSNESKNASKERLLQAHGQLLQQNDTLDRARRVMADTEEVGMEITAELARNRETLETAHGRVREVSGLTNRARRVLQNMSRRAMQQKLALYTIGVVIVLVIGIILWNIK